MYAADIYGQVWKITYNYWQPDATKWAVTRIFTANPGSNLASGSTDYTSATLDDCTDPNADCGRKTFYSPDVTLGNEWSSDPVLYFGTGDRAHPRYRMISNRFYMVTDDDTLADETDLLNLTCNELDQDADSDHDGDVDDTDYTVQNALKDLLWQHEANGLRGAYRILDEQGSGQGSCTQDSFDHTGEHVLSKPVVFFENIYFTSFQPVFGDPCSPEGNALIYALDYSWLTAGLNFYTDNDSEDEEGRDTRDTYRVISGSTIPSGVKVIIKDGKAAGLTSAGGSIVGAGEDGSTSLPGELEGATLLLWETQ